MYRKSQDELDKEKRQAEYKDFKRWQKIVAAKNGWLETDHRLDAGLINRERTHQSTVISSVLFNMNIVKVPYRLGRMADSNWNTEAVHYQIKIWIAGEEKQAFVFAYSQGSGIKQFPTIREILYSFIQDALLGSESFVQFCDNVGGDTDSRKTFKSYEDCVEFFEWFVSNRLYESRIQSIAENLQEAENMGDINRDFDVMTAGDSPTDNRDMEIPF